VLLLATELVDELVAGVSSVGAPDIQHGFAVSYELTAWVLLVIPALLALALEPALFLLADRHPRRPFVVGGLAAMAAAAGLAAVAPSAYVLAAALSISAVASGVGVALSQATLADAHPHDRDRMMTRWAMLGWAGGLAAPAILAGLAAVGLGWRTAFVIAGVVTAALAIALARAPFPAAGDDAGDEPREPLLAALGAAVRNRRLVLWLAGCWLCNLLDDILVVFATIHLRDDLGAGVLARSAALAGFIVGGAIGLAVTDRLLRTMPPVRVLAGSAAACTVAYAGWLIAGSVWGATIALAVVGLAAAPLYPIAIAQAYAAAPGRSGAVNAAGHLFTPLGLALPWLLGWLADTAGPVAALAVLAAQPIGLLVICVAVGARRGA
jgi:predicted MFS family arabinose efflux permease